MNKSRLPQARCDADNPDEQHQEYRRFRARTVGGCGTRLTSASSTRSISRGSTFRRFAISALSLTSRTGSGRKSNTTPTIDSLRSPRVCRHSRSTVNTHAIRCIAAGSAGPMLCGFTPSRPHRLRQCGGQRVLPWPVHSAGRAGPVWSCARRGRREAARQPFAGERWICRHQRQLADFVRPGTMTWEYAVAGPGNMALHGELQCQALALGRRVGARQHWRFPACCNRLIPRCSSKSPRRLGRRAARSHTLCNPMRARAPAGILVPRAKPAIRCAI